MEVDAAFTAGTQGGGGGSGGENSQGIFTAKKSGNIFPTAKFSRPVTNNFTANSDAGEYCGFRHVQRCTRRREGCLFATCSGCDWNALEIRGAILSLSGHVRNHPEPTRK